MLYTKVIWVCEIIEKRVKVSIFWKTRRIIVQEVDYLGRLFMILSLRYLDTIYKEGNKNTFIGGDGRRGDMAECFIICRIKWMSKRSNRIISIVERNI